MGKIIILFFLLAGNKIISSNICRNFNDDTYDIDFECEARKNLHDTFIRTKRNLDKQIKETKIKLAKTGSPNYKSLLNHLEKHRSVLAKNESYFKSSMSHAESERRINSKRALWREKNLPLLRDVYGIPVESGEGAYKYPWAIWSPGY